MLRKTLIFMSRLGKLPIELSEDSDSINKLQINISSKFSSSTSSENTEKKLNDDISLSTSTN